MMGDLKALEIELQDSKYNGMTTQQKAQSLMTLSTVIVKANALEAKSYLLQQGRWPAIKRVGNDVNADSALREACFAFLESESLGQIDTNAIAAVAAMDGLITAGLLDSAEKADLMAMGTKQESKADELGFAGASEELLMAYIDKVEGWGS